MTPGLLFYAHSKIIVCHSKADWLIMSSNLAENF